MFFFAAVPFVGYPLRVACIRARLVSPMRPGLRMPRIRFVPCLASPGYLLTMWSSQRRIRYLEALVSTQRADLSARDGDITQLKLRIEDDARAYSRKQSELTSALQTVGARDAARDAKIANLQWKLTKATEVGKKHKSTIDELRKALMKPQVSVYSAFGYFQARS